jgi:hypothetical protein
MSHALRALVLVSIALAGGCATSFVGDAYYPGGASACFTTCANQRMEMGGFVYLGEYSSACVCQPAHGGGAAPGGASAGGAGSAVGVVMQMRSAQEARQTR